MAAIGKVYIAVILVVFIFSSSCSHSINVKRVVPSKCTTVGFAEEQQGKEEVWGTKVPLKVKAFLLRGFSQEPTNGTR
ncbi:hypothetical protein QJS10_CPA07g01174 [Acorus calamus]|uniref:Uncharacterized protein n=1 Tax=Acorus calamus TaxID=4465 RepID=A0AAV9EFU7_ACOCL|nr:hypothetical protein QJS10_CPA07g01174 [Acorus calamus]